MSIHSTRPNFPAVSELAEMVRDGMTLAEVGVMFDASARSVQSRLNNAGYERTGEVQVKSRPAPRPASPKIMRRDETWMERRACDSYDADLFYPEGAGKANQEAAAKEVCGRCDVRARCLEWAMEWDKEVGYAWGVHGGLTGDERRALRRNPVSA